jgi:hypothetical protein
MFHVMKLHLDSMEGITFRRRSTAWAALLGSALLSGCGNDGRLDVYPVTGTVTQKGQPIQGAKVVFFGQEEHLKAAGVPIPEGETDASGKFALKTYEEGDGAPAGTYKVSISWMEVVRPSEDPEATVEQDRLKGRYVDPEKSGLTATVAEDDTELPPFELQ